ncbi:hypothetical protein Gotur_024112 [Gossypium turneri]
MTLLRCSKIQADRVYSRAVNKNLKGLILAHPNTKKKVDVFALSVYGLVVFPKALGHVDEAVTDLFDRLDKRVTPVPEIVAIPRQDLERKMDGNSSKSLRRGYRMESSLDASR